MPFYDDSGKEVSADDVKAHFEPPPDFPTAPGTVAENIAGPVARIARKVLPRAGTMTAGTEIGAAAGGALAGPPGAMAGASIGGGLGNVAGKFLPEEIGGDPKESTLGAFAAGAVPEGIARGVAGALEKRIARKSAEAAHDAIVGALDKGPMPAEAAGQTAGALGRTSLARPPVLTGEALTDATSSLRKDILDPITTTRRNLGEPIGKAYEALKGNKTPISEKDASDLADAAQTVRDEMISPYPRARAIFNRIKNFVPQEGELDSRFGGRVASDAQQLQEMGGGEGFVQKGPPSAESLRLQNYTEKQIQTILAQAEARKPPTLDELREMRQQVNEMLRSAKGGDVHALAGVQQALDEKLMPHLPAGINRDRELYRGFIQRFPWRDINKVNQMGTPRELGDYVFGGTPERAHEIIDAAGPKITPTGRGTETTITINGKSRTIRTGDALANEPTQSQKAIAEALKDRALNAVNPDLPLDQQVAAVRKVLTPYIADGTAAKLFGKSGADDLREVFYAPEHLAQMKQIISTPEAKDVFVKETANLIRNGGRTKLEAVDRGFEKLVQSLPPPERDRFMQAAVPGAEMPVLPTDQQALQTGLTPGASKIGPAMARRAQFTGPYAAGRAAMGSPGFAAAQLLAMAGIATTSAGYRAIMENGGASALSRLYASPTGRATARTMIETLAAIGTQGVNQATKENGN